MTSGSKTKAWRIARGKTKSNRLDADLLREIEVLASENIKKRALPTRKTRAARKANNSASAKGLAASPGEAHGPAKVVTSSDDAKKVTKGDVGIFHYFNPDMVPAIAVCAASIGLYGTGGRTGHLAIVSRELGIPCVVGVDSIPFDDGVEVFVNGNTGEIRGILA